MLGSADPQAPGMERLTLPPPPSPSPPLSPLPESEDSWGALPSRLLQRQDTLSCPALGAAGRTLRSGGGPGPRAGEWT